VILLFFLTFHILICSDICFFYFFQFFYNWLDLYFCFKVHLYCTLLCFFFNNYLFVWLFFNNYLFVVFDPRFFFYLNVFFLLVSFLFSIFFLSFILLLFFTFTFLAFLTFIFIFIIIFLLFLFFASTFFRRTTTG